MSQHDWENDYMNKLSNLHFEHVEDVQNNNSFNLESFFVESTIVVNCSLPSFMMEINQLKLHMCL